MFINMKRINISKIVKLIICNILLITIFVVSVDFIIYMKLKSSYINDFDADSYPPVSYIDNYRASFSPQSFHYFYSKKNNIFNGNYFRPRETKEAYNNKKSILIFGCSFAFGAGLNDNEIISSKLSEKTKRNVFNFGICASGISHMLALLQNEQLLGKIPPRICYIYLHSKPYRKVAGEYFSSSVNG